MKSRPRDVADEAREDMEVQGEVTVVKALVRKVEDDVAVRRGWPMVPLKSECWFMSSNTRSRGVEDESIDVVGAEKVVAMANGEVKDVGDDKELIFLRRESSALML